VDGPLVVGGATKAGRQFAFTADLADASPRMRSLGTLGGNTGIAVAVDGGIAVGSAEMPDHTSHAFAVDLAAAVPQMTDLGTRGRLSVANAIDGDVVAGESGKPDEATHATAWILSKTTAPSTRFSSFHYRVDENAGLASVTVTRAGDPAPAVSVRYSTRNGTARAGKDFSATSGTLAFAPGQTRTSFKVRILNDSIREAQETLLLDLTAPTGGAVLGTPRAAGLRIRPSDQQPDAWIGGRPHSGYVGNNIYNATGARQTKTLSARRTQTRVFYVRVYNDGASQNTITLRGSPSPRRSTVRFYRRSIDVTAAMRSPQGLSLRLRAHAFRQLRVETTIGPRATIGSTKTVSISGTWTGDSTRTDLVRAATHVIH
jgi:Calx-beta domain-containing protein